MTTPVATKRARRSPAGVMRVPAGIVPESTAPRYPLAHVTYGAEEIAAVRVSLTAGRTTMGPRVAAFEEAFARYVGAPHAAMVNSGSSADLLCAFSLGPPHRGLDEVLVPAVTWPTQVWACVLAGYRVRLVDTAPDTLQMELRDLESKISLRTAAIFPVHVLGNVGDMDALCALADLHSVPVLEDCCEALGARWGGNHVGTFGKAAAFSFFFSHLVSTMEGGMVVTHDDGVDRDVRLWRSHGWKPAPGRVFSFPTWGMNVRPTEVQGAFGNVQLGRIEGFLGNRRKNYTRLAGMTYERYPDLFRGARVAEKCLPGWHGFSLTVRPHTPFTAAELCAYLDARGVETRPLIAGNLARQEAVAGHRMVIAGEPGSLPGADAVHERAFYIGLASHDDEEGTAYVGEMVKSFVEGRR